MCHHLSLATVDCLVVKHFRFQLLLPGELQWYMLCRVGSGVLVVLDGPGGQVDILKWSKMSSMCLVVGQHQSVCIQAGGWTLAVVPQSPLKI